MSDGDSLWAKVCATVNGWGGPRSPRIRTEEYFEPNRLDLHGVTVNRAYELSRDFVERSHSATITIITGRSGTICAEMPYWLDQWDRVRTYRQSNDGGAFIIRLKPHP